MQSSLLRLAVVVAAAAGMALSAAVPAQALIQDKRNDFTGDGISDVLGVGGDCLYRWSGTGSGTVGAGVELSCGGWDKYRYSLAVPGDLDGDKRGDLVAINEGNGCLYRWLGTASGNVGTGQQLGCGWGPYQATLAGAGDLNNDGYGDLVAINHDDKCLYRWMGNGAGSVGAGYKVGCGWGPYTFWTDERYGSVTGAGDINGDGNADLTAINYDDGCLYRWYGTGTGGIGAGTRVGCGWSTYALRHLTGMGDFNGDGVGDLVGHDGNCVYRWLGTGNGGYGAGTSFGCGGWGDYTLAA